MMAGKFLILFALLAAVNGKVRECQQGSLPSKLEIVNCGLEDDRCVMYRGENGVLSVTFKVPSDQEMLYVKVIAYVAGLPVTFPMPDPNACNSLTQGLCPVDEGEEITYKMELPIQKYYPKIPLDVEISLLSEDKDEVLTCFIVQIKVEDRN